MSLITSLTPEQEAKIPEYRERYRQIGLDTTPCDRAKAEAALKASYKLLGYKEPEIEWYDSPAKGAVRAAQAKKGSLKVTKDEVKEQAYLASYGSFDAYWVSTYAFIAEQLPVKKTELIDVVKEIIQNCGVYWTFEDLVIVTEKPVAIHMKDEKLHNESGLALEYKDGFGVCAIEGTRYKSILEAQIAAKANS